MITRLVVSNYVLISQLEVDFVSGFTAITGETGAGKSIILGALGLLLGQRADAASRKHSDKKAIAEGTFNLTGYALAPFFAAHDLDYDETHTTLRREILPSGKSRAFVNDTPVKLTTLKALGEQLVDIHSQHENQQLLQPVYQLRFLDAFAGLSKQVEKYSHSYRSYKASLKELEARIATQAEALQKADYLAFQLQELDEAQVNQVNFEELKAEYELLDNADEILQHVSGALFALNDADETAITRVKDAINHVADMGSLAHSEELVKRLESVAIELDDIRLELENVGNNVEANPNKLMELKEQMDAINRLLYKHQLTEFEQLVDLQINLQNQLDGITHGDEQIEALEQDVTKHLKEASQLANSLHAARQKAQLKLAKAINSHLARLGMPNAVVAFELTPTEQLDALGNTQLRVLFSANKGFTPEPLEKVASGGERSRLMLVLKKIFAEVAQTPTLILDEIDTGISGEVAAKTANMLAEMTGNSQVVSITHLPQVAAKANAHFLVHKQVEGDTTVTQLRTLSLEERAQEIARMLSGENVTDLAIENAKQLMAVN
jgi:DNA repair protein RecN (Recombination protein N)